MQAVDVAWLTLAKLSAESSVSRAGVGTLVLSCSGRHCPTGRSVGTKRVLRCAHEVYPLRGWLGMRAAGEARVLSTGGDSPSYSVLSENRVGQVACGYGRLVESAGLHGRRDVLTLARRHLGRMESESLERAVLWSSLLNARPAGKVTINRPQFGRSVTGKGQWLIEHQVDVYRSSL